MARNLANSAVAIGLEKVNFHSNPKERQCQSVFKLLHYCTYLTRQQCDAQRFPRQASTVCETRTSRCSIWISKGRGIRDQMPMSAGSLKKQEFQKNIYFFFINYAKAFDCVNHNQLWKILQEIGMRDHLTCLLRNLYVDQEATVRTGHRTTDWFQIRKGVYQGCKLLPCLFNLHAKYIMRNYGLDEA